MKDGVPRGVNRTLIMKEALADGSSMTYAAGFGHSFAGCQDLDDFVDVVYESEG